MEKNTIKNTEPLLAKVGSELMLDTVLESSQQLCQKLCFLLQ
jgi:hypothetical protein